MIWAYHLSVWLHILAAAAWIGSMLFFAIVVVPASRAPEIARHAPALIFALGRRYRIFGWCALATLVVTGTTNLFLRGFDLATLVSSAFWSTGFGRTLSYKLFFVVLVLASTGAHELWTSARMKQLSDGTAPALSSASRRRASWLGRSTLALSMFVLWFAISLVRGAP